MVYTGYNLHVINVYNISDLLENMVIEVLSIIINVFNKTTQSVQNFIRLFLKNTRNEQISIRFSFITPNYIITF